MYEPRFLLHTTRQPRPGEVHGEHYFVNHDEFKEMISRVRSRTREVLVITSGTSREAIELLATGVDVFLDIDWQVRS